MAGDKWQCSKCTFLHLFPGQRCTMCNALRVSKEEMRNFIQGKKVNAATVDESSRDHANVVGGNGPLHLHGNQESSNGGSVSNGNNGFQQYDNRATQNNTNENAQLCHQASATSSSVNYRHQPAVMNPYAKQSRPSSSYNKVARENNSNDTGQKSTSTTRNAPAQGNAWANQQRPPTANPYSNNRTTVVNVSPQNNLHQGNNHQQQRISVNNPYNKSGTAAATLSNSNAPIRPHTSSYQQPHTTGTSRHHTTHPNNNNAACNNVTNSQQNNQQLHRFFTGARPTTMAQPSQRPQTQVRTGVGNNSSNAMTTAATTSAANRQRLSLSAKKQLPYIQGPVPLCAATSHNWIYPRDDKYPERIYQLEMSESALMYNTLVSLPTGLGKTLIAAVVMYNYYRWFPEGKVIFCAPTRPLVTQQIQACYKIMGIPERHTAEISGRVPNTSRQKIWDNKRVFFCTPQTLVKDIEENRCDASKIVCVVMDEAHRATGMHTFALLPNMIEEAGAKFRLVALSATPGTDIKSIQAVVETLKISKIEARTEDDPNVKRYIHHREEEVISVKQPDVVKILDKKLLEFVRQPLERLRSVNAATRLMGDSANLSPFAVMKAREEYVNRTGDHRMYHTFEALRSLVDIRINLKNHGIQYALQNIARKELEARGPLALIFHSDEFKALKDEMQAAAGDPTECLSKNNPKYETLTDVLLEHFQRKQAIGESTRAIVFSQLRESVMGIVSMLSSKDGTLLKPTPFVGQSSRKKESESNSGQEVAGMNQAEQQRILKQFNEGVFNVLVCTCVGEEGLDIGDVDLIVNFDILKSAIRSIQRTGRTGRKRNGRVIFLVSEGQEERSYRDSVTNSKKIARALKDPSVFKLCPNSPMFPDQEPVLLRQKMVVDDFHMSQVGGHTPKTRGRRKSSRSSKRQADKAAGVDDTWRLSQAQQMERMNLFGNLPYSSHSKYGSEPTQGVFPSPLRKKYLKARRGAQIRKYTGRGRSTAVLASLEEWHVRPPERNEPGSTPKNRPIDRSDDTVSSIGSVGNMNHSDNFDVRSDNELPEDLCNGPSSIVSEKNDDSHQNGCKEVSPDNNIKDSLGAIFGEIPVMNIDCLNSQHMAILFDSDEHKHCSIRAPPQYGDFQSDDDSESSDESSSFLSHSSKQSHLSTDTMDDDALCAFFENSQLPKAPHSLDARQDDSTVDECDNAKSVDNAVCHEVDFHDESDLHASTVDAAETSGETERNFNSNDVKNHYDSAELNPSDPKEITQKGLKRTGENAEEGTIDVPNFSSTNQKFDDDKGERSTANECPHPEVLDSIDDSLSPILPLSQVAAFRLPTPPPSSSEEDDEDDDSDEQSGQDNSVLEKENESSLVNVRDGPTAKSSPDRLGAQPFENNSYNIFSDDARKDEQEDVCNDEIAPLQLPTQYSSSSSDDEDESESQNVCDTRVKMQRVESPKDIVTATNDVKSDKVQSGQTYAIGTKVSKEFKDPDTGQLCLYHGTITAFYREEKLYNVVFEDGDSEDMDEDEIASYLDPNEGSGEESLKNQAQEHRNEKRPGHSQMSLEDDLLDTPVKKNVRSTTGAISRMTLDQSLESLTDTPVLQHRVFERNNHQMSMDTLTDTPIVQPAPERKSRMSMDSLVDTPVQQLPERKRLRPNTEVAKDVSTQSEQLSKQDRLKRRIEEKYRCKFLDTEAANDDSDSGDEDDEEDDEMSDDGFINDTSQLGYSQDDLDRLNESVEECDNGGSDTLHRQLNHQQSVANQFKTPVFNRRMQLSTSEQSQTSLPPSQRGLGNMNFIRSVIDHCRQGGDSDQIETEYHRLAGKGSSQDNISMSQMYDDTNMDLESPMQQQAQPRQLQPPPAMATSNANNNDSVRVGLESQPTMKLVAIEPNSTRAGNKGTELSAEQRAMIEAKRQAALRLRQQKQKANQQQRETSQVRFNPYAK